MTLIKLTLLSLFFFILSCKKNELTENKKFSAVTNASKIINGEFVSQNETLAKHVVLVHNVQDDTVCTGTIIMKNLVVTAAHCISKKSNTYRILFSTDAYDLIDHPQKEFVRTANKTLVHEKYVTDYNHQPEMNQFDIALIYFNGGLPEGYEPVEVLFDQNDLQKNQQIILAGFGVDEVTSFEMTYKKSKKFQDKIDSGEVVCDEPINLTTPPHCLEISMSGDGVLRKTQATLKYTSESEFVLDERKAGTCSGDSGGPAFIEKNGILYLAGVTSRGDLLCNNQGIYTIVPYHLDWILSH